MTIEEDAILADLAQLINQDAYRVTTGTVELFNGPVAGSITPLQPPEACRVKVEVSGPGDVTISGSYENGATETETHTFGSSGGEWSYGYLLDALDPITCTVSSGGIVVTAMDANGNPLDSETLKDIKVRFNPQARGYTNREGIWVDANADAETFETDVDVADIIRFGGLDYPVKDILPGFMDGPGKIYTVIMKF